MDRIQLGHGSGGRLMHQLISEHFVPALDIRTLNDSAVLEAFGSERIAVTTDSYVISPYFFSGGDIGRLAVCGTVNDLSVAGARPLYLTAGFIIEEGLPLDDLRRILASMRDAAAEAGIRIVAGDTKVVERGKGDGIYINTAGFGTVERSSNISPSNIRPGDRIIISGTIANHGMAVMAERNGITFDPPLLSDVRPLNGLTSVMLRTTDRIRVMRDPTRGGIATTLKEFAADSECCMMIYEEKITVLPGVQGACDLLGIDPLYVANEGILVAVAAPEDADELLCAMRMSEAGRDAVIIGEVLDRPSKTVLLKTGIGGSRIIDMISGDQLPRIC